MKDIKKIGKKGDINMKKAKLLVIALMILVGVGLFAGTAMAAWYTCTVDAVGPGYGNVYVKLTDTEGSFTERWFKVPSEYEKMMLATALTANANNAQVVVNLSSITQYSSIIAIYVLKN